jgi:hypothetical protein
VNAEMLTSFHRQRSKKLFSLEGENMNKNRWFNWVIGAVLIGLAVLTVYQFVATVKVVSANAKQAEIIAGTNPTQSYPMMDCPFTQEQIRSIHPVYIPEIGHNIPFTEDGPTGVEGGLYMLRYCKTP